MQTLKQALESANKNFKPFYERVAEEVWHRASALTDFTPEHPAFTLVDTQERFFDFMRGNYRYLNTPELTDTQRTLEALAKTQYDYAYDCIPTTASIRTQLSPNAANALNLVCIQSIDIMQEVRETMKAGNPYEYAAAVACAISPEATDEITDAFMKNLHQMDPNMPAQHAYAQAMYTTLHDFEVLHAPHACGKQNDIIMEVHSTKQYIAHDMSEMGIEDRDDVGDDEVGEDE